MSIEKLGSGTLNRLLGTPPAATPVQAGGGEEAATTVPLGDVSTVSPQALTEARPNPYDYIAALPPGYQPPSSSRDIGVFQAQGIDEVRGDQASGIPPVSVPATPPMVMAPPAQPPVVVTPPVQPPVVIPPPVQPPVVNPSPVQPAVVTPPVEPSVAPPAVTASPLAPLALPEPEPTPKTPPEPAASAPVATPEPKPQPRRRLTFSAVADPHVTTSDGRKFDNSQVGSFLLARSKSGDLAVQVHQDHLQGDSGVWQTKAAIRTHGDAVRFDAATLRLEINGQVVPFEAGKKVPLPSGGYVEMSKDVLDNGTPFNRLRVHTQDGDDLYMLQFQRKNGGRYLDLSGSLAPTRASGEVMGSAGSFDGDGDVTNDWRGRDGSILHDLATFLEQWRLKADESLF